MTERNEWQTFFNGHAPKYMNEPFTRNTKEEIEFILEELKLKPESQILDVGCGTGRHSIELAKKGFKVTGIDISSGMLTEAKKAAKKAAVTVTWIQADAANFKPEREFDAALCLCEGAFGLLSSTDKPIEHDLAILRNINAALRPSAKIILTAPNGFEKIRKYSQKDVENGKFDPLTTVENFIMECETPSGTKRVTVRERGYIPTELILLFSQAGFKVEHIWGGTAGNWRQQQINMDEIEIMTVARKATNRRPV